MSNPTELTPETDVRAVVREKYGLIAEGQVTGCCGQGCGCDVVSEPDALGYTAEQIAAIPEGADLGLGCGNPLAFAAAQPGETVLDLGSGAGIDAFLAARAVGPTGHVIGVDMTQSMIERARANAVKVKAELPNVEFRLGEIEHLPVADATVDLIISNCVVNLSPDKPQVFREAFRALRPGGRMLVSDLVWNAAPPEHIRKSVDALVGCVAGASLKQEYLDLMKAAGFGDVEIVSESGYQAGVESLPADSPDRAFYEMVRSVKVRAIKPKA